MTGWVTGLLVVQLLLGGYLLSFVLSAGAPWSNARASRIPDPIVFGHLLAALAATVLWVIHVTTGERGFAWARTLRGGRRIGPPTGDPAEARVAEKQTPPIAIGLHGLFAALLLLTTALVAAGIAG